MNKYSQIKAAIAGAVIAVTALLIVIIYSTEPKAQREAATKKIAMLVGVDRVQRGTFVPVVEGLGTVQAAQDVILSPRVDGRIIGIDANFIPGGFVEKGTELLKIDPADYENRLRQMESALMQAQADLDIEEGRRDVAQKEYTLLGEELKGENRALVLREPQLAAARARLQASQAQLNQASLELARTSVRAPFDAQIVTRNTNIGSEVNASTQLARLAGTREYWVIVSVPVASLELISLPQKGEQGSKVLIRHRTAWPPGVSREGRVVRLVGAVDGQTRLARILVSVDDPLALQSEKSDVKMLIGTIVQAKIEGRALEDVFRIRRDLLRDGERLWLNRDGKLVIADATVVAKDKDFAYISEGMEDGDLLVNSNLSTVAEGTDLRVESDSQPEIRFEERIKE